MLKNKYSVSRSPYMECPSELSDGPGIGYEQGRHKRREFTLKMFPFLILETYRQVMLVGLLLLVTVLGINSASRTTNTESARDLEQHIGSCCVANNYI